MMKKILNIQCFAVLSLCIAISFSSCTKLETEIVSNNKTLTVEFQQVASDTSAEGATRTEFHEKTIWWSEGDAVYYGQFASVDNEMTYKRTSVSVPSTRENLTATISSFNVPDEGTDSYYFSLFPFSSYSRYSKTTGHIRVEVTTPDTQAPTSSSFDPAADLLISNYAENLTQGSNGKYTVTLSYYRQVALGKMRLVNLPTESTIASVEFSAIHNESAVTLAGTKWYDFTTQGPVSVESQKYKLTLDYSGQNISGDMTAYFCCYPFELGSGDSFTVKVVTEAGETFTRKVILPASRTLSFEADRGTQFTVDMSKATKIDDWLTVKESTSYTKTANTIYYSIKTSNNNVKSGKYKTVSEAAFSEISDIGDYLETNGSSISSSNISKLNSGTSLLYSLSGLNADTWYVVMVKLVLDDDTEGVAIAYIKTDWFSITAKTRAGGGISYTYYGANLASATRNCCFIATDALPEGTTFEEYYNTTLEPGGIPTATLNKINSEGSAVYYTTKYYTDKNTQVAMNPGTNYTMMIKAVNERGETKFVTASANAGGTTE